MSSGCGVGFFRKGFNSELSHRIRGSLLRSNFLTVDLTGRALSCQWSFISGLIFIGWLIGEGKSPSPAGKGMSAAFLHPGRKNSTAAAVTKHVDKGNLVVLRFALPGIGLIIDLITDQLNIVFTRELR